MIIRNYASKHSVYWLFRTSVGIAALSFPQMLLAQTQNDNEPILSDEEFESEIPELDPSDKTPLETIEEWEQQQQDNDRTEQEREDTEPQLPAFEDRDPNELLPDPPVNDPELDEPLPSITDFDAEPPPQPTEAAEDEAASLRYSYRLEGLDGDGVEAEDDRAALRSVKDRFDGLSALAEGDGKAANAAMVAARLREDQQLLIDLLQSEGFYDAATRAATEEKGDEAKQLTAVLTAIPGPRYRLGIIDFDAPPVEPVNLITRNFIPKAGDPIVAEQILAAEANISVALPNYGYPFAKVGQRDILLDPDTQTGDYTLPVDTGPRSYFGKIITSGDKPVFGSEHIERLRRFKPGELYDARKLDDLRAALVSTGLLSTISVEAVNSDETAPDGTAYADLLVRQEAGPARTIAGSLGYATGQGFRAEASWTHRNLFPPEGALTLSAVAGTQEQALGVTFRRSNAGKRDRAAELSLAAQRSDLEAFRAESIRLAGRISRESTPIWQKRWTYSYGFELLGSRERELDVDTLGLVTDNYLIFALPGQLGYDRSNSLLDPTKGYRLNLRLSPEVSLGSGQQIYARTVAEAASYVPLMDNFVFASRLRVGSILGAKRANITPSRRYYGGGGGSVRGFGFQELGPRAEFANPDFDPNDPDEEDSPTLSQPIGGRSLVEASAEARYRFGSYGVVAFVDAGQVYTQSTPQFDDWRFGVGIGGRFYTNFGPVRLDIATPINRRPGESRVSVYVSIGQAF
ncbi:autotransporter assembly complex family protein [Sphingorhabdus arenilitoris]|uniref:Autotransporter assembly complex family protein n=1 Tax=Sphingorhabdus arenilitoris TaxID=1490041 RepID=A0ABV8RCT5_9SPHN